MPSSEWFVTTASRRGFAARSKTVDTPWSPFHTRNAVDERRVPWNGFTLTYEGYEPVEEGLREALTSTATGTLQRGAAEWEDADDVHYPGTYAHGVYNRETTILGGRPVLNEDLVKPPQLARAEAADRR